MAIYALRERRLSGSVVVKRSLSSSFPKEMCSEIEAIGASRYNHYIPVVPGGKGISC